MVCVPCNSEYYFKLTECAKIGQESSRPCILNSWISVHSWNSISIFDMLVKTWISLIFRQFIDSNWVVSSPKDFQIGSDEINKTSKIQHKHRQWKVSPPLFIFKSVVFWCFDKNHPVKAVIWSVENMRHGMIIDIKQN